MQAWTRRQFSRIDIAPAPRQPEFAFAVGKRCRPIDRGQAIAQARAEIRQRVEDGDMGHEEVTMLWIEQWAADIYRYCLAA